MLPFLVALLTLASVSCGANPAVRVILTDKGLQYGKHVGAGWIQDRLENLTLPEIRGDVPTLLGTLHYSLTGVTIGKVDFPEPSVEFYEDTSGLKWSVSGLSVALTGEWRAKLGILKDKGSFKLALFTVDVASLVMLGKDPDGRLSVSDISCDAHVGDLALMLQGRSSWLLTLIVKHYKMRIRGEIEDRICPGVEQSIVELEHLLQAMNVSFDVDKVLTLDLPLTEVPAINSSSLSLGLKGEFYSTKTHAEPPFEVQPFTLAQRPDHMFSVGLSAFTLNSASYGLYSAGLLQALIVDSMIPPLFPLRLNTSAMGPYVPQLPKMFPGLLMSLHVNARDVPLFSFMSGIVALDAHGAVRAFAIQPNGTETPLFTLNSDLQFSGKMWIADGKLKGSMGLNNFTLTLARSEVGPFKTAALRRVLQTGLTLAMATVNAKLGKGIDLPRTKQAELVNTVLEVDEGFIAISSDVEVFPKDYFY